MKQTLPPVDQCLANIASVLRSLARIGLRRLWPYFVFAGLLVTFLPEVFFRNKVFLHLGSDLHVAVYSFIHYFKESIQQGILPLWNPFNFCGFPYDADSTSHVNLLNLLALFLEDIHATWNLSVLGSVFLTASFTYAYMKRIGWGGFPGSIAGIIFGFSGSGGAFEDSCGFFLPLALWAMEEFEITKKSRYLIGAFLTFVLLFLNALPQYSLYMGAFFAIYTLVRFRSPLGLAVMFFSFGAISFHTFRMFEALQLSSRPVLWFVNVLFPPHLLNMIFPFFFESPFHPETNFFFAKGFSVLMKKLFGAADALQYIAAPYIGVLGFSFFIFSWKNDKPIVRFYLLVVTVLFAYLTTYPILSPLYRHIPLLAQLPRISRLNSLLTFCLAVLAGAGTQQFMDKKANARPVLNFYLALSSMVIIFLSSLRIFFHFQKEPVRDFLTQFVQNHVIGNPSYQAPPEFYFSRIDEFFQFMEQWTLWWGPSLGFSLGAVFLVCFLIDRYGIGKMSASVFRSACTVLLSLDLLFFFRVSLGSLPSPEEIKPRSKVAEFMSRDKEIFRIMPILTDAQYGVGRVRGIVAPHLNILYGLSSVEGWNPFMPKRYAAFFRNFQTQYDPDPAMIMGGAEGDFDYRLTDFLNVKYFLAAPQIIIERDMQVLLEDEYYKVYLNPTVLPRAFLVHDYLVLKDDESILAYLKNDQMVFDQTVVLEEQPEPFSSAASADSSGNELVKVEAYNPHFVQISARALTPGFLVLSDTYYPGWKARVDGQPVKTFRANYGFRAVQIMPGDHQAVFSYEPDSFKWGLLTSIGFVIAGLLCCGALAEKNRLKIPASPEVSL